jgi:hypothetical protein
MLGNSRTTSGSLPPLDPSKVKRNPRAQRGENVLDAARPNHALALRCIIPMSMPRRGVK